MDLCFLPATRLATMIRQRKVSPLEATRAILAQIERINPKVNAYCTVVADSALADARRATAAATRRRARLPRLHGVPVSIKDNTATKGIRTTWGSKLHEDHVPTADALIVERLRAAGAIVLGKTNTPEFAAGANTRNEVFGATRNPWNLALTCGGSTGGGAVALATGMGPLAQGTDLGGSLRIPAAFCGVVGLRPSPGLVPIYPTPLAWDSYGVAGPMARTVGDVALMLSAIAGPDPRSPISYEADTGAFLAAVTRPNARGLRIAWGGNLGVTPLDDEVHAIVRDAMRVFRSLGARVRDAQPDFSGVREVVVTSRGLRMVGLYEDRLEKGRDVMQRSLVRNIEAGLTLTASEIAHAERHRSVLWSRLRDFFRDYDLIATPTVAVKPFPIETWFPTAINGQPMSDYTAWMMPTYVFTVLGVPAISIPCGFTADGLPVGLQLVGRWRDEATVLRAAAAFEAAAPWADRRPPVVASAGERGA